MHTGLSKKKKKIKYYKGPTWGKVPVNTIMAFLIIEAGRLQLAKLFNKVLEGITNS